MGKFFRKSFNIDLKDSLAYPSGKTICDIIEREQKNVEFISKENPVIFKIEDGTYEVSIKMARGGYYLSCREVKE
ncbi:hypothetical protein SDC9_112512 [bioreactor metagenome]|jgi:Domain of unknown function (DUF4318)|uniref:DUF4318 domain-containing protein n=1 Tax=bioreactor metagenome TaxID=1076179 RepID=A0A645BJR0_9ZZZZ